MSDLRNTRDSHEENSTRFERMEEALHRGSNVEDELQSLRDYGTVKRHRGKTSRLGKIGNDRGLAVAFPKVEHVRTLYSAGARADGITIGLHFQHMASYISSMTIDELLDVVSVDRLPSTQPKVAVDWRHST